MARTVSWFVRARQEDMRQAGFALVELCALPIPPDWPQFGIELTAGWARRGWQGAIAPEARTSTSRRKFVKGSGRG